MCFLLLIPVAMQSKVWVCSCWLAGIVGSNPAEGIAYVSLVSVVCCQVEVSVSGLSLIQSCPTNCSVS